MAGRNDLFTRFGQKQNNNFQNGSSSTFNNRFDSMSQFFDKFESFKKSFEGNPEQKVQELLDNGSMSQSQYNMLYGLAKKILNSK